MKNTYFLGIDQTGAVNPKGIPRPLPCCLIIGKKVQFFYIDQLSRLHLKNQDPRLNPNNTLICIDCVLGWPKEIKISWREALSLTKNFPGYGRGPAQNFFSFIGKGKVYHRQIEIACKANSVFREKPFQKNIQTGTFRFWKDLYNDEKNFYIPVLENSSNGKQFPVYEGYPSYSWRILFKESKRTPSKIKELLKKNKISITWSKQNQEDVLKDPNLADAFLLALTLKTKGPMIPPQKNSEGWILGHPIE